MLRAFNPQLPVLACVLALSALAPRTYGASHESAPGTVVLIGGILRYDNAPVWQRIVELAGGINAEFVVIPAATGRARLYGGYAVRALQRHGASAELLPIAIDTNDFGIDHEQAAQTTELLARIRNADGIFFTGGAPQRIAQTLYRADGVATPLLVAIREQYSAGVVVAGANAGHAIVSTSTDALLALQTGLPARAINRGLGLLNHLWLFDQHLFTHGRFAVSLAAMRELGLEFGLGVGVNTAVIVSDSKHAEVIGENGAMLIDLSEATLDQRHPPLRLTGAKISYLGNGDSVDLATLKITPDDSRIQGFEIDPNSTDHNPGFAGPSFYPDIFIEPALPDLLFSAVDSDHREGIGLALAPPSANDEPGFKFRFYTGTSSFGWIDIDNRYTVSTIYLNVIPASTDYLHRQVRRYESGQR